MAPPVSPQRLPAERSRGPGSSTMRWPVAAVLACLAAPAWAQASDPAQTVTVTGRQERVPAFSGFGDQPLARAPLAATVVGAEQMLDAGLASLAAATRFDAAVGDAYNAEGYWSSFTVRGFALDNRFNFRRDGLPVNAETALPLGNKARLEWLKGTSGIQAGTSAPGGLVNLVVKRPTAAPLTSGTLAWQQDGTWTASLDWSRRFGAGAAEASKNTPGSLGVRVNASASRLDPVVREAGGTRRMLALAGELVVSPSARLEAEIEWGTQRQPSVPGFSLLGGTVPEATRIDPRVNLNNQPWTRPVVMTGQTASVRWTQRLSGGWQWGAHAMTQRLHNDDRTAFPYGVFEPDYSCPNWCDRFAPDGRFSFWEYVSDGERRISDALELSASGRVVLGGMQHQLSASVLATRYRGLFNDQVFDLAGTGRIDGRLVAAPSGGYTDANTNRHERSTEWSLRDAMRLNTQWQLWAGVRHTRLDREAERTSPADDGLRATRLQQAVTTPWLAIVHDLTPRAVVYASWGQGVEVDVAPNRARYANAGQPLPALKSRQLELGWKHQGDHGEWALAAFDIDRPLAADLGPCDAAGSCRRAIDGSARHRGLEAQAQWRSGAWAWQLGAMWLDAQRRGASDPAANGLRPVNVPRATMRAGASRRLSLLDGAELGAWVVAESDRLVLPAEPTVKIPGWSRLDLHARWQQRTSFATLTWRAGVDNVTDRRAWRESPYQFGHAYLFPLAPRTWRFSVQAEL